jgi:hypothetical protein
VLLLFYLSNYTFENIPGKTAHEKKEYFQLFQKVDQNIPLGTRKKEKKRVFICCFCYFFVVFVIFLLFFCYFLLFFK